MDEDSILFQAMKNEMSPQIDPAAMRFTDPQAPYSLGVEVRAHSPRGLGNPARMVQPPSDFAGRPAHANTNPARVGPNPASSYTDNPMRPSGNVINQNQAQWELQKFRNQMMQEMQAEAARAAKPNSIFKRGMDWIMGTD